MRNFWHLVLSAFFSNVGKTVRTILFLSGFLFLIFRLLKYIYKLINVSI